MHRRLLDNSHYTDVRFWHREVWGQHYAEQDNAGKAPCRTGFIEGSNGICVSDERKRQMSTTVYAVLNQLHSENRAPQKWGAAGDQIHSYAVNVLGTKYSEFRYCDDSSWKALEFIKHKFSDWDRNYRKSGKLDGVCQFAYFHLLIQYRRPNKDGASNSTQASYQARRNGPVPGPQNT